MAFSVSTCPASQSSANTSTSEKDQKTHYIAYYFYTSKRCASCYRIENWSEAAIKEHFGQALREGNLRWKTVKVDHPENKHFVKDYNLYTKSVVIVEKNGDETVRWKNLEKVWRLLQDKKAYFDYVTGEIKAFMEKS
ncbi:MAG: nitrophenyl compound nitroreductase subunit ArsF family protein [Desulfohalobiaceae bacterium]